MRAIENLIKYQGDMMDVASKETKKEYQNARNRIIAIGVVALALSIAITFLTTRSITRPIGITVSAANQIAEGDLTAKATSEIGDMIKAIQDEVQKAVTSMNEGIKRVNVGVELSTQAGNALQGIVKSVNNLQTMVQQIASATEEMSTVSETISGDIETIATVSKETSAGSEQIAQSSSDLARLASNLQNIVRQFKV